MFSRVKIFNTKSITDTTYGSLGTIKDMMALAMPQDLGLLTSKLLYHEEH